MSVILSWARESRESGRPEVRKNSPGSPWQAVCILKRLIVGGENTNTSREKESPEVRSVWALEYLIFKSAASVLCKAWNSSLKENTDTSRRVRPTPKGLNHRIPGCNPGRKAECWSLEVRKSESRKDRKQIQILICKYNEPRRGSIIMTPGETRGIKKSGIKYIWNLLFLIESNSPAQYLLLTT